MTEGRVGDFRDVVARKRDGATLSHEQIREFTLGYARGEVSDPLAAAFLMAAYIRGLDFDETVALTRAMVDSGATLHLAAVSRPKIDKHSTGGVADSVTLILVPLLASLGFAVAKLSGRGLAHTGGTLDKLESIPGLRTDLSPERFERQVEEVGCAVAAQTPDLVPADGAFYELRNATATVPSIPLIAASIMSKKLAVETDLILLDMKTGSGAFMKSPAEAEALASTCMALARSWGRRARAAVTDMSQPLGDAVGNALDVAEAIEVLRGERGGRLTELVTLLAMAALSDLSGIEGSEARKRVEGVLSSGQGAEEFRRMVEAQGGDPRVVDDPGGVLPRAPVEAPIPAPLAGFLQAMKADEVGHAAATLGAGRFRKGEPVDPAVGIVFRAKIGDVVEEGESIGTVHARTEDAATAAIAAVHEAISIGEESAEPPTLIYGWHDSGP